MPKCMASEAESVDHCSQRAFRGRPLIEIVCPWRTARPLAKASISRVPRKLLGKTVFGIAKRPLTKPAGLLFPNRKGGWDKVAHAALPKVVVAISPEIVKAKKLVARKVSTPRKRSVQQQREKLAHAFESNVASSETATAQGGNLSR